MDAITPNTAAGPIAPISATPAVRGGLPDLSERTARFDALSSTVLDTSGRYSDSERLKAYSDLHTLSATGGLIGIEDDRRKVLDQVTFDSDIGQRAQQLSQSFIQAVNTGGQSGGASGALKAAKGAFDNLSSSDQAILFATTLNAADRLGQQPYANVQAWRDNTEAQSQMVDYMQASGAVGANGQLDYRAAAAKSADPKFAAALKLSQRRDNNSADWTQSVLSLFTAARAPDRVELSPEAQKLVGTPAPSAAPAPAAPYKAGTLISRVA
jgi:hypothetical protein